MKWIKCIKKIVPVLTAAALLGSTIIGGVYGSSLDTFPRPMFINDEGAFTGSIVVGDNAGAADVLGAVDIMAVLQAKATKKTLIDSPAVNMTEVQGDAYKVMEPTDILEINETLGRVKETLTEDELQSLAKQKISTNKGTTYYNQYLKFGDINDEIASAKVVFMEDENDVVSDYLYAKDGDVLFEYEIEFEEALESDIDEDDKLEDFEDESLVLLGDEYYIVEGDIDTATGYVTLTMVKGQALDTLEEGEIKVYTVDGAEYEVEVLVISDTQNTVMFRVNGETSKSLDEGETDKVGGMEIGVREILPNEAGDISQDMVEFYLGADKVEFEDKYTDDEFSTGIEIDENNVEDGLVMIKGNVVSDVFQLSSIKYRLVVDGEDGDVFVPSGHGIKEYLDEPEGFLSDGLDITYNGLDQVETNEIEFSSSGDDQYKMQFYNRAGTRFNIDFLEVVGDTWNLGNDDETLWFLEPNEVNGVLNASNYVIKEDDMFVLTDQNSDEGLTVVMKYESIDTSNNQISFSNEAGGQKDVIYSGNVSDPGDAVADLIIGGNTYKVYVGEDGGNNPIAVDLDRSGDIDGGEAYIVARGGAMFDLGDTNNITALNNFTVTMITDEDNFDERDVDEEVEISFWLQGDELDLDIDSGVDLVNMNDEDRKVGLTAYGAFVEITDDNNEADDLSIDYPIMQRGATVYVSVDGKVIVKPGTDDMYSTEIVSIPPSTSKFASEVSSLQKENTILIGGPCANPLTAQALGMKSSFPECVEDWGLEVGEAIIKVVEMGDRVAMIVAGTTGEDTRRAAKALARNTEFEWVSDEVKVTGTSMTDVSVSVVE